MAFKIYTNQTVEEAIEYLRGEGMCVYVEEASPNVIHVSKGYQAWWYWPTTGRWRVEGSGRKPYCSRNVQTFYSKYISPSLKDEETNDINSFNSCKEV
tara:strand:+ start:428 stop:721 length:294 start_codon:yes stop_codon:yes gene_type:complete